MIGQHHLKWSDWELALLPAPPVGKEKEWPPRASGPGFRKRQLFKGDSRQVAVYEIAVQRREGCKKFVVFYTTTGGFALKRHTWETYLLRNRQVKAEVNRLLDEGWRVHVRRACLNKGQRPSELRRSLDRLGRINKSLLKKYDYAWRKNQLGRRSHRPLIKSGCMISDGSL